MPSFLATHALLPTGWASGVRIDVADDGTIATIAPDSEATGCDVLGGLVIPGMPNLHSHSFQRAMAGTAERSATDGDSFWTWRAAMYQAVRLMSPEDIEAVARQAFVEMLKGGYTSVAEFHYLHNGPDGSPYGDVAETSERVVQAALASGIRITHLPVLYAYAGFGEIPPGAGQRRFVTGCDRLLRIVDGLRNRHAGEPRVRVGVAPHSLRAVSEPMLADLFRGFSAIDPGGPVHIHVAEQEREVQDCLAHTGRRPVELLLERLPVGPRWTLVHATHLEARELSRLAASGAVAGLCPTTEANLGDGLFPLSAYLAAGGRLGIGSDSNVTMDAPDELRLLEYGQRLAERRRCVAARPLSPSTGEALLTAALEGGRSALGSPIGRIEAGAFADFLVLDPEGDALAERPVRQAVDALVFAGGARCIRDVYVGGRRVVENRRHPAEDSVRAEFRAALRRLRDAGAAEGPSAQTGP